jgi:hypothetical protein
MTGTVAGWVVSPTPSERADCRLSEVHVRHVLESLAVDGFAVVSGIVSDESTTILRNCLLDALPDVLESADASFNFHDGNVQQELPREKPFLLSDVLLNAIVGQVASAALGPGAFNAFYSANTALPSTKRQPVHVDVGSMWPGRFEGRAAKALIVNVPLVDVSPANGATELWPGSHLDARAELVDGCAVAIEALDVRRGIAPPVQPSLRAGDVLIRDMRLWHAGMPNTARDPRPMLAMIHLVASWHPSEIITFPASAAGFFADAPFRTALHFE